MSDKQRSTSQVEGKHTPGPWHTHGKFVVYTNKKDKINTIAEVHAVSADGTKMPREANARLIAAAPELFEILDALLGFDSAASYRARTRGYELIKELKRASK